MESTLIEVHSGSHVTTDITHQVQQFCEGRGDGLCSVFVPHATAGVALFETGSGTEEDVESFLEDVLPRDERYRHRHGSPGHGRDHVLPAFISPSLTIPVLEGRLQLARVSQL
ncbi:MAG: YjbQ family protein [Actinomycetota bacterium]|nr:YjbQ family protein [Actinomycetota bacterium]